LRTIEKVSRRQNKNKSFIGFECFSLKIRSHNTTKKMKKKSQFETINKFSGTKHNSLKKKPTH